MKETKFKQTLVQTKEGSRHCEERSDVAIQSGFKMTEVGMIPHDWEVFLLSDLCSKIFSGKNKEKHEIGNYLVYGSTGVLGYSNKFAYDKPAILIARVGANAGIINEVDGKYDVSDNTLIVYGISCCQHYIYEFLKFWNLNKLVFGSGQPLITGGQLKKIEIPLPPTIEEQQRIANALSDVDTLIANLEKLIAKKKNIKQGAMQQLLTGRKRLPEFAPAKPTYKQAELGKIPTDWECVNISKTCTIKARIGWQGLKSTEYLNSGNYILVTGTDFKNGFIDWSTCSYVSEWRFKQDKNIQIKKGDVLVTKDGTIGKVAFLNEIPMEGTLNSGVFVVRSKDLKKIDSVYLSLVFKSSWFDNFLDEITSGSTIVHLYQKDFVKFNFPVPSSIDEQTAIANVLSDMDTEIATLETKLAKYRKLKTGMMQQLLTGKIRLV